MNTFVRQGFVADLTKGAKEYPLHQSNSRLIITVVLCVFGALLIGYAQYHRLPENGSITQALQGPGKAQFFIALALIAALLYSGVKFALLLAKNNQPSLVISADGLAFRDGQKLGWKDIESNVYSVKRTSLIVIFHSIEITPMNGKKLSMLLPEISSDDYLAVCDIYRAQTAA